MANRREKRDREQRASEERARREEELASQGKCRARQERTEGIRDGGREGKGRRQAGKQVPTETETETFREGEMTRKSSALRSAGV